MQPPYRRNNTQHKGILLQVCIYFPFCDIHSIRTSVRFEMPEGNTKNPLDGGEVLHRSASFREETLEEEDGRRGFAVHVFILTNTQKKKYRREGGDDTEIATVNPPLLH